MILLLQRRELCKVSTADNKRVALLPIGMEKVWIVGAEFYPLAASSTGENVRFERHEVSIGQGREKEKKLRKSELF